VLEHHVRVGSQSYVVRSPLAADLLERAHSAAQAGRTQSARILKRQALRAEQRLDRKRRDLARRAVERNVRSLGAPRAELER
jgi:hypothetical protein